jgi:signal transduction histidine kinase
VEDDRDDFFLTQDLLQRIERERYWVVWAGSFERAKLELHERKFDVALVDYRIGERTGLDFISEVGPRYPDCPMILLTGLADPDIDFAAERAGAADYLVKDSLTEGLLDRSIRYARQSAQRRALLDGVLSNAATGMIGLDASNVPIMWNAKAIEALQLDGTPSSAISAATISETLGRVIGDVKGPREIARPDGRSFEVNVSRMKDGGAVVVLHDITMRVQAENHLRGAVEEAERANKAKSSFLATMSHELRTPLNGILGMARVLSGTRLDEVQRDGIDLIRSSGTSLLNIINDILDLSKIEAGRMELEHIEVPVAEIVDDIVRLLAPSAAEKGVELSAFVDPRIAPVIQGDPLRIRQIVTNLVGNAIKFTNAGSILVAVDEAEVSGNRRLRVSVIDTGIGIPTQKIDRLFQKFSQVDASTTREFGGTGLGLALCKELVGLMGGEISCSSLIDHGSTFRFSLPLPAEDASVGMARRSSVRCFETPVLLVSSNTGIVNVLGAYARACESSLVSAPTLDAARRTLDQRKIEVVFVDGTLGESEAAAFVSDLRRASSAPAHVFFIEGRSGQGDALRLAEADVIARPFVRNSFEKAMQRVKVASRPSEAEPADRGADEVEGRRLRILMAEDNPANQRVARALLQTAGYRLEIVADGRLAVERAQLSEFDLILMDVQMPVMDGLTATRRLRECEGLRQTPIIGLTAGAMEEDRGKCLAAGMTDYLSKPVDWDRLLALLDRIEREVYGQSQGKTAAA